MTGLSDTEPDGRIRWLCLSWKDWADNPGFEASGDIAAICQVGSRYWDTSGNDLSGIRLDDCELK